MDIILKNTLNMKQISLHVYQSIDGCPAPSDKHFDAAVDASSCVLIDEETYLRIYMNHLGWPITAKETLVVTNGGIDLTENERVKFIQGDAVAELRQMKEDGDGIRTQAFDPSKLEDPHLIIYAPVRVLGDKTIVTNGDQTDTIYEHMENGQTFEQSLRTREFEDDDPNFTPRISGIIEPNKGGFDYSMSILKSADGNPQSCQRYTFSYNNPLDGEGHFIHTYMGDGSPLPSFEGEPKKVAIPNDIDEFTDGLWNSLNADNKVSLFVRFIDLATGETKTKIVNKNK